MLSFFLILDPSLVCSWCSSLINDNCCLASLVIPYYSFFFAWPFQIMTKRVALFPSHVIISDDLFLQSPSISSHRRHRRQHTTDFQRNTIHSSLPVVHHQCVIEKWQCCFESCLTSVSSHLWGFVPADRLSVVVSFVPARIRQSK